MSCIWDCISDQKLGGGALSESAGGAGIEVGIEAAGAAPVDAGDGVFTAPGPDGPNRAVVIGPCVLRAGAGACTGTGASCSARRHDREIAYGG